MMNLLMVGLRADGGATAPAASALVWAEVGSCYSSSSRASAERAHFDELDRGRSADQRDGFLKEPGGRR